tara:strand:- start:5648 stop:6343 length:696 start_codon:yes stop_codon:yes gene_type:complete
MATISQIMADANKAYKKQTAAEQLSKSLEATKEKESGFRTFLSYAAPLIAMGALPLVGTIAGPAISSLLAAKGLGAGATKGIMSLLATIGTGLGERTISEGLEMAGRATGFGGDEEDIAARGLYGEKASKEAREYFAESIDEFGKQQDMAAIMAGLSAGAKFGLEDSIKNIFKNISPDKSIGFGMKNVNDNLLDKMIMDLGIENIDDYSRTLPTPKFESRFPKFKSPKLGG